MVKLVPIFQQQLTNCLLVSTHASIILTCVLDSQLIENKLYQVDSDFYRRLKITCLTKCTIIKVNEFTRMCIPTNEILQTKKKRVQSSNFKGSYYEQYINESTLINYIMGKYIEKLNENLG